MDDFELDELACRRHAVERLSVNKVIVYAIDLARSWLASRECTDALDPGVELQTVKEGVFSDSTGATEDDKLAAHGLAVYLTVEQIHQA
jgi:hypothetical protein